MLLRGDRDEMMNVMIIIMIMMIMITVVYKANIFYVNE
jgi:hypothetical protein